MSYPLSAAVTPQVPSWTAWWSSARMVIFPTGTSSVSPSSACAMAFLSVPLAFSAAAL